MGLMGKKRELKVERKHTKPQGEFDPMSELQGMYCKISEKRAKVSFKPEARNAYFEFERETCHSIDKLVSKCKKVN